MLVALSYPEVFAIKPSPTMMGELAIGGGGGGGNVFLEASPFLVGGSIFDACNPYYYGLSLYGWDGCSPYGYGFYTSRFGFPPYDYYGGGGWYEAGGGGGIIVGPIVPPSSQGHGQVVNGKGYVSGDSGGSSASSSSGGSSSGSSVGRPEAVSRVRPAAIARLFHADAARAAGLNAQSLPYSRAFALSLLPYVFTLLSNEGRPNHGARANRAGGRWRRPFTRGR